MPDLFNLALVPISYSIEVDVAAIVTEHLADNFTLVRDFALEVLLRSLLDLADGHGGVELVSVIHVFDGAVNLAVNGARDDTVEGVRWNVTANLLSVMEPEHLAADVIDLERCHARFHLGLEVGAESISLVRAVDEHVRHGRMVTGLLEQDLGAVCASCLECLTDDRIERLFECVTLKHERYV